jgi:uncharacterized protein
MLTRRSAIALPVLAVSARAAVAQPAAAHSAGDQIVAADSQQSSLLLAQTLAARLGNRAFRAEEGKNLAHCLTLLTNRDRNNLAVLPSTTLAWVARQGASIPGAIRFIARVCVMEIHVLASQRIARMAELAGQKVNMGPVGSQGEVTASLLLERAALRVDPVYVADNVALRSLIQHQLAAMIFLAAKPSKFLFDVSLMDGVHLLPMLEVGSGEPPTGGFPTRIDPADYPLLGGGEAGAGQPIPTMAIPLVLACNDWPAASEQFLTFARAADVLSQRGSGLPGFSMTAAVPGWQRFGPVSDWLKNGGSISGIAEAAHRAATPNQIDYQKLYLNFREWQKQQHR